MFFKSFLNVKKFLIKTDQISTIDDQIALLETKEHQRASADHLTFHEESLRRSLFVAVYGRGDRMDESIVFA